MKYSGYIILLMCVIGCLPQPEADSNPAEVSANNSSFVSVPVASPLKDWPEAVQQKLAFLAPHFLKRDLKGFDCQEIDQFFYDWGTKVNTDELYELKDEEKERLLAGNQQLFGTYVYGTAVPVNGFYPLVLLDFGVTENPLLLWLFDETGSFVHSIGVANAYGEGGGCMHSKRINDSTFLQYFSWDEVIIDPEGEEEDQFETTYMEQELIVHRDGRISETELKRWMKTEQACANNLLKQGDIIFQTSLSSQSQAIQLATNSPYSHMGILFQESGKWFVFEAIQPVKMTPLDTWI